MTKSLDNYKVNCYYYQEEVDMGAHIPTCSCYIGRPGYCPCDNCKKYISKEEVDLMVQNWSGNE